MAGLDLLVSSSLAEAFPTVLGEAMACAVPCVATNAGDSGLIIGNTGSIVPIDDPSRLADAMCHFLTQPANERQAMGLAARKRITEQFNLPDIVIQYETLFHQVLGR
jgi:glycosyltransferase involved in cell wall biosynthesis